MLSHEQIWGAIDGLASHQQLSPSGLAKKAGLDPTTFNRSKRIGPDGRQRWPSTESIAKALDATNVPLDVFMAFVSEGVNRITRPPQPTIPLLDVKDVSVDGNLDDDGYPYALNWNELSFPNVVNEPVYAIEVSGAGAFPLYRDGDILVVSPGAAIRKGDRLVVRTQSAQVFIGELKRQTAKNLELRLCNQPISNEVTLQMEDISWIARIVWLSQ